MIESISFKIDTTKDFSLYLDCFAGLTFVLTGVYESLERDEMGEIVKKYGGKVRMIIRPLCILYKLTVRCLYLRLNFKI